jgi:hypothetical protein
MDILKALDWAGKSKADIVNMSFTGPDDSEQHIQLAALHRRGAVLIAAAGNGGPTSPALYPAADPEVIAVTATDSDDNLYAQANRGAYIAVAAPGVSILVASPGGSYALRSGRDPQHSDRDRARPRPARPRRPVRRRARQCDERGRAGCDAVDRGLRARRTAGQLKT